MVEMITVAYFACSLFCIASSNDAEKHQCRHHGNETSSLSAEYRPDAMLHVDEISALQIKADLVGGALEKANYLEATSTGLNLRSEHLPVFVVIAIVVGICVAFTFGREIYLFFNLQKEPMQNLRPNHRHYMFGLEMFRLVVTVSDSMMLLPGALNFAKALGWSPTTSGILDQLDAPGSILGGLLAFILSSYCCHGIRRRILVCVLALNAALEVLLAFLMVASALQEAHTLIIAFISLRIFTGFASGVGMLNQIMLTSVCSPQENALLGTVIVASLAIGAAVGPLIPSLAVLFIPESLRSNAYFENAVPLLFVAVLQTALSVMVSMIAPLNLNQASYTQDPDAVLNPKEDAADGNSHVEGTNNKQAYKQDILEYDASVVSNSNRAYIVVFGQMAGMGMTMLAFCGLQALPVLLQKENHWTLAGIAPAVACMALSVLLAMLVCAAIRIKFGTGADVIVGTCTVALSAIGSLLIFTFGESLVSFESGIQVVVGSCLVAAFNGVTGSFLSGYGFAYADENKWYSKGFMSFGIGASAPIIGLTAGPLARGLALSAGRNGFAVIVVIMTVIIAATFFYVRLCVMTPGQDGDDEDHEELSKHNLSALAAAVTDVAGLGKLKIPKV